MLMADAGDGQRWPRAIDCADLLWNAILAHLHHVKIHRSWDYRQMTRRGLALEARHPRRSMVVRVCVGIWLLFLTAIMYGYGVGGWWGALLVPAAALHFYLAYRLRREIHR